VLRVVGAHCPTETTNGVPWAMRRILVRLPSPHSSTLFEIFVVLFVLVCARMIVLPVNRPWKPSVWSCNPLRSSTKLEK